MEEVVSWIFTVLILAMIVTIFGSAASLSEQKTDFHLCMVISKDNYTQCKPLLNLPQYGKLEDSK